MRLVVLFMVFLCSFSTIASHSAYAEQSSVMTTFSNFFGGLKWQPDSLNAESEVIGNYQVVVTTNPLTPMVNKTTNMEFKVYNYNQGTYGDNSNYAETGVNHFTMGIRVFYNDQLVDNINPQVHMGDSWSMDYTFHRSGNHVLKIDLYDADRNNQVITYIFNIPVNTIFGPIFEYILIAGSVALTGTLLWVKFVMTKKKAR